MRWTAVRFGAFRKYSTQSKVSTQHGHLKPKVGAPLPYSEIPAAKRLPLIGTTLDLMAAGSAPKLHKFIDGRHQQLGPIFRERLGSTDAVFLACPKMMRSVFLHEGQYPVHPVPDAWLIYNRKHRCQRGLFFMDGEEWFTNRRSMNQLLLNRNEDEIKALVTLATQRTIDMLKGKCGTANGYYEIPHLEHILYRWSIDVILFVMIGNVYKNVSSSLHDVIESFARNVYKIFEDSAKLVSFPAKLAEFLNLDIWKHFERSVTNVMQLGNQVMDQSIAEFKNGNGLLSVMLQRNMQLETAKRIILDLIIAAGDTTTFASIWALHSLATNNEIQNKARDEIHSDRDNGHKYIKQIIRETLRLYPVAPFIGRFVAKNAVIGSYEIPKGTLVLLSLYTSGRDDMNFINAKEFNPSRWERTEGGDLSGVIHVHGTVPFALGSRSCIGRKIAMLQMQSLIKSVMTNFQLISQNDEQVDIVLRLVAVPDTNIKLAIKLLEK